MANFILETGNKKFWNFEDPSVSLEAVSLYSRTPIYRDALSRSPSHCLVQIPLRRQYKSEISLSLSLSIFFYSLSSMILLHTTPTLSLFCLSFATDVWIQSMDGRLLERPSKSKHCFQKCWILQHWIHHILLSHFYSIPYLTSLH